MERVRHPIHGGGEVVAWRRGGREALVRFDGAALPRQVPRRELTTEAPAPAPTAETPALTGSYEVQHAARTLEAMRLGVVPDAELSAYTVGRDTELALVDADLARADAEGGAVRAFLGDYGTGKTHLLELVQRRALDRGFLSAHVVLSADEVPPSHPKRVYRALVHGLRYPDRPHEEGAGLGPLLARAATTPDALAMLGIEPWFTGDAYARLAADLHLYLAPAVAYWRSLAAAEGARDVPPHAFEHWREQSRELLVDWIEGHPTLSNQLIDQRLRALPGRHPTIYSLLDYRPWARIYGYLLSGLAAMARAVGYRGLVVTLDEAEFYALLSRENRDFARHLFKAWTFAAIGAAGLPFEAAELDIGGYGVLQRLPPRYGDHPGLYVVFAMTPSADGVEALEGALPQGCTHALTPLADADYRALAARVCDFYTSAQREWSVPEKLVGPLGKVLSGLIAGGYVTNPRQAMKFVLEFLDVVRFHPGQVAHVVRNLQLQLDF